VPHVRMENVSVAVCVCLVAIQHKRKNNNRGWFVPLLLAMRVQTTQDHPGRYGTTTSSAE
jgi:hypothetical protein